MVTLPALSPVRPVAPRPAPAAPVEAPAPADRFDRGGTAAPISVSEVSGDASLAADVSAIRASLSAAGGRRPEGRGRTSAETYDLRDRAQVEKLIAASPQKDALRDTKNDDRRCAAAAVHNSLLADGNFESNAKAIEQVAKDGGRRLTDKQRSALESYRKGQLGPAEGQRIQELLYQLGAKGGSPDGLTSAEMGDLVGRLRNAGAYKNTESTRFMLETRADGSSHWTMNHRDLQSRILHADSWPGADGKAKVERSRGGPGQIVEGGALNPRLTADFTIQPQSTDTLYRFRMTDSKGATDRYIELYANLGANAVPELGTNLKARARSATDESILEDAGLLR